MKVGVDFHVTPVHKPKKVFPVIMTDELCLTGLLKDGLTQFDKDATPTHSQLTANGSFVFIAYFLCCCCCYVHKLNRLVEKLHVSLISTYTKLPIIYIIVCKQRHDESAHCAFIACPGHSPPVLTTCIVLCASDLLLLVEKEGKAAALTSCRIQTDYTVKTVWTRADCVLAECPFSFVTTLSAG